AIEINWIALQSAPSGAQIGTTSLDSWTIGTECKKIYFPQFPGRPQDAMAVWVEDLTKDNSFKICLGEVKIFDGLHKGITINWMAYTNLRVDNFTLSDSLVFTSNNSPSQQIDYAFCQKINFTDHFYASPVVMVTVERINNDSHLSGCNAITAWVEYTSTAATEICVRTYDAKSKQIIKVDYLIIGGRYNISNMRCNLDPCIDVLCDYHGLCKAFGPHDARCVCIDSCPQYQEPVCSSNGTTYDNTCLFKEEMCLLQLNYTVQHPGSCEGIRLLNSYSCAPAVLTTATAHLLHVKTQWDLLVVHVTILTLEMAELAIYHQVINSPNIRKICLTTLIQNFTENHNIINFDDNWLLWLRNMDFDKFCPFLVIWCFTAPLSVHATEMMPSRKDNLYITRLRGSISSVKPRWWESNTFRLDFFLSSLFFSKEPSVFVTVAHHHAGLKRDAASIWLEDISLSSFKLCLRELQNYAGSHEDIYVNWLAFPSLHKPLFSEHSSVYFPNSQSPGAWNNNAFCGDISFTKVYQNAPSVFVSANHTSSGGGLDPMHNSITAWVEYINTTGARICLKELHESKYDPLSVSYTVLS
ncbi:unnamed protein product, partial [Porites evermanni]